MENGDAIKKYEKGREGNMNKIKTFFSKKLLTAIVLTTVIVQSIGPASSVRIVKADVQPTTIGALLTEYTPTIAGEVDEESGFTHPGVGLTKTMLDNVQTQVRAEEEPWKSYFEDMLASSAASKAPTIQMTNPESTAYNSQSTNSKFIKDALTAYTQAILYYVTGDNTYRKNALDIIRQYEKLDPTTYTYFSDACIHVGIPMNRMCIAAEIIRYSSYQLSGDYTDADLAWTEEDTNQLTTNLINPAIETFMSSPDNFMNQHLYTVIGAMSGYLFTNNAAGYAKTVEWFTVNEEGENPGFNGSIKRLFREITTVDEVGTLEGSGTPLDTPVIQHVEMGRDQAHGCGDLTNAALLSRMVLGQNTKVDPAAGTVSEEEDAVGIYEFLDDRILKTADFFFEYMLGNDADWVQVPFSMEEDGTIIDNYTAFSSNYRGRYQTINFWDLYVYYAYQRDDVNLEEDYPYFNEGFMKKMPSNYYWNGSMGINWDNVDGGGDFWLFLPAEAKDDSKLIAEEQVDYLVEIEDRGSMISNKDAMAIASEDGVEYIRFSPSAEESKLSITSGGVSNDTIAFRIRTDGIAKLSLKNGVNGSIYLPDTDGAWEYVTYTRKSSEGFGDLYYIILSDIEGTYVDIDAIDIKPSVSNDSRTIDIVNFEDGNDDFSLVTYVGAPFNMELGAANTIAENAVSYYGIDLPDGMTVNSSTGAMEWTPSDADTYSFYIAANANATTVLKKLTITVADNRDAAINQANAGYDDTAIYVQPSVEEYEQKLEIVNNVKETATDEEFSELLNELCTAVTSLQLVSPLLSEDSLTDGNSLDYADLIYSSSMGNAVYNWIDEDPGSFVVYVRGQYATHIIDFGPDFKISAKKFGYQARLGFSDRLAGVQVFGSNDKKTWTKLTKEEASYTQAFQTVEVEDELQDTQYRYLKIQKTTEYPESLRGEMSYLLEFSEFRIWGTRYEVDNKIESISISSEQSVSKRIKMEDTVTVTIHTKETINSLNATIQGHEVIAEQTSENVWTASAVMNSGTETGNVNVVVTYVKSDGTNGDTFYGTTDDSSLFLVNSDIYIDTAMLAAKLTATSGSWDGKTTADGCAALLFDGDVTTFGDLKNASGEYYTVDFGEGVQVSLQEIMLMPRSTAANHASRMDGTVIYGSNSTTENITTDTTVEWTQLTPTVSGSTMEVWTQIQENDLLDTGAYRYFKIAGATQGDIAEVEFYGTYHAAVEKIANQITEMADQEPSQSSLVYPSVPQGYTIRVKTTSNPDVVTEEGTIHTPQDDTEVDLVLTVEKTSDHTSADTVSITVTIKGMGSLIKKLPIPERGATFLTLPTVPEGFTVSIEESTNTDVIGLNGTIQVPDYDKVVTLTLRITRDSDGAYVLNGPYTVLVYGSSEAGKIDCAALGTITSSDGSTAGEYAFDSNTDTFADVNTAAFYTVDFGEGIPVIINKVRIYPRSDSNDNNAKRSDGTRVLGSNDGENWVEIIPAITGFAKGVWKEIAAENFSNYGAFRYLKVGGCTRGSMAEVEFYGVVGMDVEQLAEKITSIPDVTAAQTEITMPAVPTGYTVEIASTSDPSVIAMNGSVSVPKNDTQVTLTFRVSGFEEQAVSGNVVVNVEGMAGLIRTLPIPEKGALSLTLPTVREGFSVSVADSSDEEVIALDGTINVPVYDRLVTLMLQITRDSDSEYVLNGPYTILVYGLTEAEKIDSASLGTITSSDGSDAGISVFDNDESTFADVSTKAFYTVDFGEDETVLINKVRVFPRNDNNAKRSDGTSVWGSNDGENWVEIIASITGFTQGVWKEVNAEDFGNYGEFRYLKVGGCTRGSLAEVEFYGLLSSATEPEPTPEPTPEPQSPDVVEIAAAITSIPVISVSQGAITMPDVASGCSIAIESTSNPDIIALDGTITTPEEDTQVTLTFRVSIIGTDESAVTGNIVVTVPGSTGGNEGGNTGGNEGGNTGGNTGGSTGGSTGHISNYYTGYTPNYNTGNITTTTETKQDGTVVATKTEKKEDGTKVVTVTETKKDGTSITTITEKGTNSKGNNIETKTVTDKDSNGKVTGYTVQTKIQASKTVTVTVEVKKDADGKRIEAVADVTRIGKESTNGTTGTISGNVAKQVVEAAGTDDVQITTVINKIDGKESYTVSANAKDLIAGEKLCIVKVEDGKMVLVNAKEYTVSASGNVSLTLSEKADYQLLNQFEMNKLTKEIKKNIGLQCDETVKVGENAKILLNNSTDMENIKKVAYYSTSKKVAGITKDGKISAKKAGTVMIKARVTLMNGSSKVVYQKVKIIK